VKPEWSGAPLARENNYQEKQSEIRRNDDDDDMTIQDTDENMGSRDRF
jgi:hypothetical protein